MSHVKKVLSFFNYKALIFSIVLAALLVFMGYLTGKYPFYTQIRMLRFFIYSITLMLPGVIMILVSLLLKYVFGIQLIVPDLSFNIFSFILYGVIFYLVSFRYLKLKNAKDKKRFWIRIGIWFGGFLILSMCFLIKTYYF